MAGDKADKAMKDTDTTNKTTSEIDEVTDDETNEGMLTPERVKKDMKREEFEPPKDAS